MWVRVLLWRFLILTTSAIGLTAFRLSKGYFFDSCALLFLFIGRLAEADIWRQIRTIVLGGEYVAPCHDVDFEGTRLFAFPSSSLFFFFVKAQHINAVYAPRLPVPTAGADSAEQQYTTRGELGAVSEARRRACAHPR